MNRKLLCLSVLMAGLTTMGTAESYAKVTKMPKKTRTLSNAVKLKLDNQDVSIEFYSPSIVRVVKAAKGSSVKKKSYSVIMTPEVFENFKTTNTVDGISLASNRITVRKLYYWRDNICQQQGRNSTQRYSHHAYSSYRRG